MEIFIACARESLSFADRIKFELVASLKNVGVTAKINVWDKEFNSGEFTLNELLKISREVDYAIFIFHPTDQVTLKGKTFSTVRDNVIFEYGLFLSNISKERCFVLRPESFSMDMRMPSDLDGIAYIDYDNAELSNIDPFKIAHRIQLRISKHPNRYSHNIDASEIENIVKSTGLTNVYPERVMSDTDILRDIESVKETIEMYSRVYISTIIKSRALDDSILKAVKNISPENDLLIRHISTDFKLKQLAKRQLELEDPDKIRWKGNIDNYTSHLEASTNIFNQRYLTTKAKLGNEFSPRAKIVFRREYLNQIMPYSLIILDKKIIYVSFYSLSKSDSGTHAPTMRLIKTDNDSWASSFLQEAKNIDVWSIKRHEIDQVIEGVK